MLASSCRRHSPTTGGPLYVGVAGAGQPKMLWNSSACPPQVIPLACGETGLAWGDRRSGHRRRRGLRSPASAAGRGGRGGGALRSSHVSGSGFGDLVRTRGVVRIIAAQLTARFPSGMLSLGLLFHVERRTGSYGGRRDRARGAEHRPGRRGPRDRPPDGPARHPARRDHHRGALRGGRHGHRPRRPAARRRRSCSRSSPGSPSRRSPPRSARSTRSSCPSSMLGPLFSLDASLQELIWIGGPVARHVPGHRGEHDRRAAALRGAADRRRGVVRRLPRGRPRAHPPQQAPLRRACCCGRRSR